MKRGTLAFFIAVLLLLAACGKAECKKDVDCIRSHFTGKCEEKKCVYTPIPNECGNKKCETSNKEDKCSCPVDCGLCEGKVDGSQFLVQQCIQDKCIEDVEESQVKPYFSTADVSISGDKFKIDTVYPQPFNMKKDTFSITVTLADQGTANSDEHLLNAELTATTKDKRTITLVRTDVDRYLWTEGSSIFEGLIIDFPATELEGELTNLVLKIQYEYAITQAGKKTVKQAILQNRYKEKFIFVKPSASYPCPASCDDKNAGTKDTCGPQTNNFCKHEPIPNACGNYKCDGTENRCTCPTDCGVCSGSAGNFLDYTCQQNKCATVLKAGVTVQSTPIFDDRSLGPVQLHNNYKYSNPLNIKEDEFNLDFKIYRMDPSISGFTIETIRILEGTQQLVEVTVDKELSDTPTPVVVKIPSIQQPEEEHSLNIGVWYKYKQGDQEKTGNFQKSLGKTTLINPG